DSEPLMAEQLAVRMNVPARYTDFARMLAEARLDVVHIATPPSSHVALAHAAIDAGCHVFVEKPFAPTAADAEIILARAREAGRHVSVNYLYNFETPALDLQGMLERGELGEIVHLETAYGYNLGGDYGLALMSDPQHWVHRLPGKLFHNVLDHVLAKLAAHLGDDASVQVVSFRRRDASGDAALDAMPDELRFLIRSGGVTASGIVSAHARPVAHSLKVYGTRNSVELDYSARTIVRSAQQKQPSAIGRLFPAWAQARQFRRNAWRNVGRFRRHEFHYFQGMRVLLARFYDAIETGAPDPIPPDQILRVCRLIDRIVDAMRTAP
ncbi:MAG TPA: Gfo/Idh/MocA family oxidoreductase, partial [Rhodanobacteraceae bacterium]